VNPPTTGGEERNEFVRGPRWRVTASPSRLRWGALATFATACLVGLVAMSLAMVVLAALDAPGWLVLAPWWLPTLAVLVWTMTRPRAAVATNDDEAWVTYVVLFVLVGADDPRPVPARVIVAVLLGGPTVWALMIVWALAIVGLADA
jgi:hypothetical protein